MVCRPLSSFSECVTPKRICACAHCGVFISFRVWPQRRVFLIFCAADEIKVLCYKISLLNFWWLLLVLTFLVQSCPGLHGLSSCDRLWDCVSGERDLPELFIFRLGVNQGCELWAAVVRGELRGTPPTLPWIKTGSFLDALPFSSGPASIPCQCNRYFGPLCTRVIAINEPWFVNFIGRIWQRHKRIVRHIFNLQDWFTVEITSFTAEIFGKFRSNLVR